MASGGLAFVADGSALVAASVRRDRAGLGDGPLDGATRRGHSGRQRARRVTGRVAGRALPEQLQPAGRAGGGAAPQFLSGPIECSRASARDRAVDRRGVRGSHRRPHRLCTRHDPRAARPRRMTELPGVPPPELVDGVVAGASGDRHLGERRVLPSRAWASTPRPSRTGSAPPSSGTTGPARDSRGSVPIRAPPTSCTNMPGVESVHSFCIFRMCAVTSGVWNSSVTSAQTPPPASTISRAARPRRPRQGEVLLLPLADDVRRGDSPRIAEAGVDLDAVVAVGQRLRAGAEKPEGHVPVLAEEVGDG